MGCETFQHGLSWTQSAAELNHSQLIQKHLDTKSEEKQKSGLCSWVFLMCEKNENGA